VIEDLAATVDRSNVHAGATSLAVRYVLHQGRPRLNLSIEFVHKLAGQVGFQILPRTPSSSNGQ
jgi:hypothetical protein